MDQLYRRPPHFCGFCRRIILDHFELPPHEARSGKNRRMYESKTSIAYEKLSEGDENGCLLFRKILSAASLTNLKTGVTEARSDGALRLSLSFRPNWRADKKYDGDLDFFQYRWEWEGGGSSGDHLNACAVAGNPAARDILSRPLVKRRRDAAFLWAKWLTQCDDEHQDCQVEADAMPSRLLFIGSDHSEDGAFRLVDCSSAGGEKLRYVALTYCWGGDQGYKTTKANSSAYHRDNGIPHKALAPFKSVTDAIHVARRLGLAYLWVDSLCIIQDDAEDKGREIGKMQDIYAGAYVTISAACAPTSKDGFLDSMQDDGGFQDFEMDYPCIGGGAVGAVFLTKDQITSDRDDQPIDARAWTYQEYFLSPRVLVFERRKVRWLCFAEAHEDGGHDNDSGFKLLNSGKLARMSSAELDREWSWAVERYSRRSLTVQSDKLPAMAGIAARFARFFGGRYLAGVWESSLARQLAWDASWGNARSTRQPRRLAKTAPTWSWASIDGYIVFGGHERGTEVRTLELEDYSRRLVSEDAPFGAVESATLVVRARLQCATWKSGSILPDANRRGYEAYKASFRDDIRDEMKLIRKRKEKLRCLETSTYLWTNAREETFLFSKGLIVVTSDEETFRRAGTFEISCPVENSREGECHWNDRYWFVDSKPHVVALV